MKEVYVSGVKVMPGSRTFELLQSKDPNVSFKCISNAYLLKQKD